LFESLVPLCHLHDGSSAREIKGLFAELQMRLEFAQISQVSKTQSKYQIHGKFVLQFGMQHIEVHNKKMFW